MSKLLKRHMNYLQFIDSYVGSKKQLETLISTITSQQLKVISEICHNIIKGTLVLTENDKITLRPYAEGALNVSLS